MIVNDPATYVFVHVPKTGGQSIKHLLAHVHPTRYKAHTTAAQIRDLLPASASYFRFAFVRNPWDRLLSLYSFLCQKRMNPLAGEDWDQEDFRHRGFNWWLLENEWQPPFARGLGWPPGQKLCQLHYLADERGVLLVDFVGRTESLTADVARIAGRVGIPETDVPRINSSTHASYRAAYDDEMVAFVARHHAADIERFGYAF
jgi:hypothetical protein